MVDQIIAMIVRLVASLAGRAYVLPGVEYARYEPGRKLKVLLVGYNGARNTGSDVRVAALADQIAAALGPDNVELSMMTLDPESTAVYFDRTVEQVPLTTIFFGKLLKACSENHVAVLCEGSTFKSMFADALTLYTCEAAGVMRAQGKPCVAYGGEVGAMSPFLERTVRDLCADVLFMARSEASYEAARSLGLEARCGTDTAWTFDSSCGHDEAMRLLREGGWDGERPLLGIAPVNPFWWPVRPSLAKWLAKSLGAEQFRQFAKWYFFSWSEGRNARFQAYLDAVWQATATFASERGFQPVIIGMERLDEDACDQLASRFAGRVPVILSKAHDGFAIAEALRSLSLLVTSRYHAQVLAMGADVPAVAVSMDERLDNLAREFSLPSELLAHVGDGDLAARILVGMDCAWALRDELAVQIERGRTEMESRLADMASWFKAFIAEQGFVAGQYNASAPLVTV